jgi:hypothetical protein
MHHHRAWLSVGIWCLAAGALVRADTLVLRDGRRVPGQLIGIRGDEVEFDGELGRFFGGRERLRVDRREVLRIEFEDYRDRRDREDVGRDRRDDDRRDVDRRDDDRRGGDTRRGRPSGLHERDVSVDSWVPWIDTGIEVRAGQDVYFSATGRVRWGPGRQDGPEGEHGSPRNENRPIPSRPAAALIGRVGDSKDYFFIGDDQGAIRVRTSGRLFLGVNDDFLKDNTGSFRVTVYY